MRSYLDILSEKTIAEAASPAAGSLAQGLMPGMAMNTRRPSVAGGGTIHSATPDNPNQEPAAAPTAAPAAALQASPAAVSTGELPSKVASQAVMAASQIQAAEQYNEPQAAAPAAPQQEPAATPAAVSNTATTGAASVAPTDGTKSATDPHTMASELADVLKPLSRDPKAKALLDAITIYTALEDRRAPMEDTGDSKFDNMMGDIVKGAVTPGKKVATKDEIGEAIWKMYELFYSYGDNGFEYLDNHSAYWDALFTKHNGDIDAIINRESEETLRKVLKELQDANRKYLDRSNNPLSELASSDNGGGIRIQAKYLGKDDFKVVINGESYLAIIENLEGNTLKGKSNTNAYKSGNEHMWHWRVDKINITNNETGDELDDDIIDAVADYIEKHHQADLIKIAIYDRAQSTSWHDQRTRDMGYIVQPTNNFNPDLKKKKPGVAEGMFTKSLNFSESFNPGKMLQKKITKLTRIK